MNTSLLTEDGKPIVFYIEKTFDNRIPESMRVIVEDDDYFVVQFFSNVVKAWCNGSSWATQIEAVRDCCSYYLKDMLK